MERPSRATGRDTDGFVSGSQSTHTTFTPLIFRLQFHVRYKTVFVRADLDGDGFVEMAQAVECCGF